MPMKRNGYSTPRASWLATMKHMAKHQGTLHFFEALSIVVGTVIGAGILGVPFAFATIGYIPGLLLITIIGAAMALMSLFLGEMTLRTNSQYQLTGYTRKYLGRTAQIVQSVALIIGLYGALLAYTIGEGEILSALFGGSSLMWGLLFFAAGALFIARGINVVKRFELILIIALFAVLVGIGTLSSSQFSWFTGGELSVANIFLVYGVFLFACYGITTAPQVHEILRGTEARFIKRALVIGTLIPPVVYLIFAWIVTSVTGVATTEVATIGLGETLGPAVMLLGNMFAFFAMATSFLTLGVALQETFRYDYRLPGWAASLGTLSVPVILFIIGVRDFINVMSIAGAFSFGIAGAIGVFGFWAARKRGERAPEYRVPSWLAYGGGALLLLVLMIGIVSIFV